MAARAPAHDHGGPAADGGEDPPRPWMRRLDPAVAAVRLAGRRSLADISGGSLVLAACSGGADSLALAAALAFEAPRLGLRAGAVTVDHGLQEGSGRQAERAARALRGMGLDPVLQVRAEVTARGAGDEFRGPEATARQARYAALAAAAVASGATTIMLGHTMDDQAETILLGLARGSGARSLAGMAPASGRYLRPLLGLRRAQTRAACAALGLEPWDDPQNADHAYARTRVRERILPLMEELIGPGVTEALARTADQLRADADVLDDLAAVQAGRLMRDWPERPGDRMRSAKPGAPGSPDGGKPGAAGSLDGGKPGAAGSPDGGEPADRDSLPDEGRRSLDVASLAGL